jgi:hypothetical protein
MCPDFQGGKGVPAVKAREVSALNRFPTDQGLWSGGWLGWVSDEVMGGGVAGPRAFGEQGQSGRLF